jgi:anti-sigma-K factor RskA
MTSNETDYSVLIPEYCNGLLDADMKALFEEELTRNSALQTALEEFNDFQQLYQEIDGEEPQADEAQFDAILSSIDTGIEKQSRLTQKNKYEPVVMAGLLEFWVWLKSSLSLPWGVALVQAAAIVILLFSGTNQDTFETLSRSSDIETAHSAISFNIVFQKSAREEEIRKLLLSIDGSIQSGPSTQGLYVVTLPADASIPRVIKILNDSTIVAFNKRAY